MVVEVGIVVYLEHRQVAGRTQHPETAGTQCIQADLFQAGRCTPAGGIQNGISKQAAGIQDPSSRNGNLFQKRQAGRQAAGACSRNGSRPRQRNPGINPGRNSTRRQKRQAAETVCRPRPIQQAGRYAGADGNGRNERRRERHQVCAR